MCMYSMLWVRHLSVVVPVAQSVPGATTDRCLHNTVPYMQFECTLWWLWYTIAITWLIYS
jgi:hypothetical protein